MALINQNSIIGITSITSPSASNVLTVHTNDTTERLRVSTSGLSFSGTNASLDTSGNISAVDGTFTGNVSIGGTLTYEDVTNIDSVGIITAQAGIHVTGGLVGIGTDNPVRELDVTGQLKATHGSSSMLFQESNNGAYLWLDGANGDFTGGDYFHVAATNNQLMTFGYAGGDKLTLTAAGDVKIGSGNPSFSAGGGLHVESGTQANIRVTETGNTGVEIQQRSGGSGILNVIDNANLLLQTNNTERLRITSTGLVGIGTDSPTLTAGNGVHIAGGNAALKLQNTNNGDWAFIEYADESNTTKYVQGYRDSSGMYAIRPGTSLNATPGITLDSNGNVGIGVNPEARLHVEENLSHSSTYYLNVDAHILVDNPGSGKSVLKLEGEAAIVYGAGSSNLFIADRQKERIRINEYGNTIFQGPVDTSSGLAGNAGVLIRGKTVSGSSTTVDLNLSQLQSQSGVGLEIQEQSNNANALATLVFNHGSLKSMIAGSRVATTNWGTDLRFYTHDTSTASSNQHKVYERMRIDSAGAVTKPHNPSANWSIQIPNSSNHVRTYTEKRDAAGNLSGENAGNGSSHGSVGKFTAPVAGTYLFTIRGTLTTGSTSNNELLSVYGSWSSSNVLQPNAEIIDTRSANIGNDGFGMAFTLYMNVNNYWALDWYRPTTSYTNNPAIWDISVVLLG